MTWEEKCVLVELLNEGDYEGAVSYISEKEVDNQAMDMFITGFDLTKMHLIGPIKDLILNFDSEPLDWRSTFRLEILKDYANKLRIVENLATDQK